MSTITSTDMQALATKARLTVAQEVHAGRKAIIAEWVILLNSANFSEGYSDKAITQLRKDMIAVQIKWKVKPDGTMGTLTLNDQLALYQTHLSEADINKNLRLKVAEERVKHLEALLAQQAA